MSHNNFHMECQKAQMFFEAMMAAGKVTFSSSSDGYRHYRSSLLHMNSSDSSSPDLSPIRKLSLDDCLETRKGEVVVSPSERFKGQRKDFCEIAEKNAHELIREEEKAKTKADKKKAKKERQRQKKIMKVINLSDKNCTINKNFNYSNSTNKYSNEEQCSGSDNKETESLDVNAAFVSKAIKKVKSGLNLEEFKKKKEERDLDSLVNKALEYEHEENFKEALQYLSDAINLSPKRIDLLLKRSLLYFDLKKFEKSARDAKKATVYSPHSPEAFYRLGKAHLALNNLSDAEIAFKELINLDCNVDEANNSLLEVRIKQLEEMGYHPNEAFTALIKSKNKTIDEAIEFLIDLENGNLKEAAEELYYSDEEGDFEESEDEDSEGAAGPYPNTKSPKPKIVITKNCPLLTDFSNVFECSSLFVGNLKKDVTYQEVHDIFIKFGEIKSIKLTTEPSCYAFINYCESDSAGHAMEALQESRWLLSTTPLLIKFPHNVVNSIITTLPLEKIHLIQSKLNAIQKAKTVQCSFRPRSSYIKPVASIKPAFRQTPIHKPLSALQPIPIKNLINSVTPVEKPFSTVKPRPPPGTEECYFWQTTGCVYGNKCFNLHILEHKGIALNNGKPSQV